jgi:integrase
MRALDPAELERMLAVADARGKAVLLLGTCCGLRREEIAPLRWEDVDLVRGSLRVRNSEWHTTKSGRQREALLPPTLISLLTTMKATSKSEFILPNIYLSYRELPNAIRTQWTKAYAAAKTSGDRREQARRRAWRAVGDVQQWDRPIEPNRLTDLVPRLAKQAGVSHCTLHDLRRTFCSYLAACGTDVLAAQKLAGHSNPAVTAKYYVRLLPETLRAQTQLPYWGLKTEPATERCLIKLT